MSHDRATVLGIYWLDTPGRSWPLTYWRKDATEFAVFIIRNPQRRTSYSYIPKPVLERLGNPNGLKFVFRGNDILVVRPD